MNQVPRASSTVLALKIWVGSQSASYFKKMWQRTRLLPSLGFMLHFENLKPLSQLLSQSGRNQIKLLHPQHAMSESYILEASFISESEKWGALSFRASVLLSELPS